MLRHAKGIICNQLHEIEVTKLADVNCPACKNKLREPKTLAEFQQLEGDLKLQKKLQVKKVMNTLAIKAEEKGGKICPTCGADMKVRKNKKDNSSFWGCTNYPQCKTTRNIN